MFTAQCILNPIFSSSAHQSSTLLNNKKKTLKPTFLKTCFFFCFFCFFCLELAFYLPGGIQHEITSLQLCLLHISLSLSRSLALSFSLVPLRRRTSGRSLLETNGVAYLIHQSGFSTVQVKRKKNGSKCFSTCFAYLAILFYVTEKFPGVVNDFVFGVTWWPAIYCCEKWRPSLLHSLLLHPGTIF